MRGEHQGMGMGQHREINFPFLELKPSNLNPLELFWILFIFSNLLWPSKSRHKTIHILMKKNLYTNICSSRNFIWAFNQEDYNHHNLNIWSINWSLVSHQIPLQAVAILGTSGNGLTQHGNQMLCQHSVGSNYKMKSKFQQTIMEQWGEAQLTALMPAEEAEVQKITDYFFVCLFVYLRYGYPWTHCSPVSDSQVLELQARATPTGLKIIECYETLKYWKFKKDITKLLKS